MEDFNKPKEYDPELAKYNFIQWDWKAEFGFEEDDGLPEDSTQEEATVPLKSYSDLQDKYSALKTEFEEYKSQQESNRQVETSVLNLMKKTLENTRIQLESLQKQQRHNIQQLIHYKEAAESYYHMSGIIPKDFVFVDIDAEIMRVAELDIEGIKLDYTRRLQDIEIKNGKETKEYQKKLKDLINLVREEKEKTKKAMEAAKKAIEYAKNMKPSQGGSSKEAELTMKLKELLKRYKQLQLENRQILSRSSYIPPANFPSILPIISDLKSKFGDLKDFIISITKKMPVLLVKLAKDEAKSINSLKNKNYDSLLQDYHHILKERKYLFNLVQELKGNIRVFCRVRPLHPDEPSSLNFNEPDTITVSNPLLGLVRTWEFEKVFTPDKTQEDVFNELSYMVTSFLDGYNVCMFTYGQTGSGKTYTMEGPDENPGIIYRAASYVFQQVNSRASSWSTELSISLMEVYNETIRDLLNEGQAKLKVKQDNNQRNHVPGLTIVPVRSIDEVIGYMKYGLSVRATGTTNMNKHSSRSHLIMTLYQKAVNSKINTEIYSKIHLIDLAGSERLNKSGSEGERQKEAQHINLSLFALGDVISARSQKLAHVPFRNSILTHLLQDSLSGDSKTLMILQISPEMRHVEETVCSLNFGAKARATQIGVAQKNQVKNNS
ncbi:unnamed protein product [Blepharisma stoltei]|uniref:Kinesin-like protein n=1 Tax=Blepharisma stoltei TaxID=1481888 RepID=A0AAU9JKU0_9CILI|nr:unnamed protein product [Blepharisma stoltei]